MFEDTNKLENLYHVALIYSKEIKIGTKSGNKELKHLLLEYGNFENICRSLWGSLFTSIEDKLRQIPNLESAIKTISKINFNYDVLTINDERFPVHLKNIENSTPILYTRGNLDLFNAEKSIAIVGTRRPELIDVEEGGKITQRTVNKGFVVISGLAQGCDTIAHENAIKYGGNTIAVLGTPLNSSYPKENKLLQEDIAINHLLVSQYPIGIRSFPQYFANRNLTTVGLAKNGVIVIRAGDKSGTQHAIRHCVEQDKPLYVLDNNLGKGYDWVNKSKYVDSIKIPNGVK